MAINFSGPGKGLEAPGKALVCVSMSSVSTTSRNMDVEDFQVTPNQRRDREMSRVDALRLEMAQSVRKLGGDGKAKEQNRAAARATGLDVSVIERLRWKKIRRIPGDIADVVRECIADQQAKQEALARHEIIILAARLQALESRFETVDPDFHCFDVAAPVEQIGLAGAAHRSRVDGGER